MYTQAPCLLRSTFDLLRHVTDNVTDEFGKNLAFIVNVTVLRSIHPLRVYAAQTTEVGRVTPVRARPSKAFHLFPHISTSFHVIFFRGLRVHPARGLSEFVVIAQIKVSKTF
jgi:hypothetical protein